MDQFDIEMENILDRKEHPQPESYTSYLFEKGEEKILKKLGEECTETIIASLAQEKQDLINESADLIFHLFVLLAHKGVSLDELRSELERRSHKTGNKKPERRKVENY